MDIHVHVHRDYMSGTVINWSTCCLHVLQFDVDVAGNGHRRQGGVAPGDDGGLDHPQGASPHRLPGLPQQLQGD